MYLGICRIEVGVQKRRLLELAVFERILVVDFSALSGTLLHMKQKNKKMAPVNGKTPELREDMSIRDAAIASFAYYYRNMLLNEKGTLEDRDPEFLHYLRVASKRLRVALAVFGNIIDEKESAYFKENLKSLAPVLGKSRDTDVYLEFLDEKAARLMTHEDQGDFHKYRNFFSRRRKLRKGAVLAKLASAEHRKFKRKFSSFIAKGLTSESVEGNAKVIETAKACMDKCIDKMVKCSKELRNDSTDPEMHEFRIRCRKFRYATEIFINLPGVPAEALAEKLIALQRVLGTHQDAVTAGAKLDSFIRTHPALAKSKALGKIRNLQDETVRKSREKFFSILRDSMKDITSFRGNS
ncbi:MAG TPA: hypothetical protein DET40_03530 [Lentisphaeria bacterium]|nr:MAG: hypothetical protein A2X45_23370 [Lentisphaerae bacterium GWF2_50_93]HCE42600.1 hypothetical protein [Lentisphaeria bacterium]